MSARDNDRTGTGQGDLPMKDQVPLHQAFSWLHMDEPSRSASFIEGVADMCAGLQTCLQLVHSTDLALHAREMGDDEAQPILGTVDRERLLRLAIAASGILSDQAHKEIQWMNDRARGQAGGSR